MGNSASSSVARSVTSQLAARGEAVSIEGRYVPGVELSRDIVVESRVLGSGMSGDVRAATHREGGLRVAVKTLRTRGLSKGELELVKNELEIMLLADHPHIANLLALYESASGDLHLVMEEMLGGEVFDRLATQGLFQEAEASGVIRQMLRAVSHLHTHGIVHRDLKLENFLFEAEGSNSVKLIDFGLARRWRDGDASMAYVCGSRDYMAPEVLARRYTQKVDIWSMGVVAYTLLCGVLPWNASHADVWKDVREGNLYFHPELFPSLSPGAQHFVRSLLALDPSQRPAAVSALDDPWLHGFRGAIPRLSAEAAQRLCDFAHMSPLQKAVRMVGARQLPASSSSASTCQQFGAFNCESSGTISPRDFQAAMGQHGFDAAEANECFASIAGSSGKITFRQFIAAVTESEKFDRSVCQAAFARFDSDGDGLVTTSDILASGFSLIKLEGRGLLFDDLAQLFARPTVAQSGHARPSQKQQQKQRRGEWFARFAWCNSKRSPMFTSLSETTLSKYVVRALMNTMKSLGAEKKRAGRTLPVVYWGMRGALL